ncbi:Probable glucan 1,3-alpha-glucosidase [Ancistrocladus abbreviatus]
MRDAIRTRYTFLPYFYTLFREANTSGVPVMRPLWMEFPDDEAAFSNDEAFMVGNSLLVQGVYTEFLVILLNKNSESCICYLLKSSEQSMHLYIFLEGNLGMI